MLSHVSYTDSVKEGFAGQAKWFWVKIRPKYREDKGLLAHELEHVRHWWICTILSALLIFVLCYYLNLPFYPITISPLVYDALYKIPACRLYIEIQCYAVQLKHYKDDRTLAIANFIATNYDLEADPEEIVRRLAKARQ